MAGTMLLPRLDTLDAKRLRDHLLNGTEGGTFSPDDLEQMLTRPRAYPASGGIRATGQDMLEIRRACLAAVDHHSDPDDFNATFDLAVGRELARVGDSCRGEMGVAQVWDFLTLVVLPDLVARRIAGSDATIHDNPGTRRRITGGDRRHALQRLWKRWAVFDPEIIENRQLTEDDYVGLLERRVTLERRKIARRAAGKIIRSGYYGSDRREYTRLFMRRLVQMAAFVHLDDEAHSHLDAVFEQVHKETTEALERRQ